MVSVTGVLTSMWDILEAIAPVGVDPIYFWSTFLLISSIIYILVQVIPQFNKRKGVALIVAAVLGYFSASSVFATIIISKLFPNVGMVLMAILGLLLVIAFVSPESMSGGLSGALPITLISFAVILYLTYAFAAPELQRAGFITPQLGTTITDQDMAVLVIIMIVIGLVYAAVRTPKDNEDTSFWKKFWQKMGGKTF